MKKILNKVRWNIVEALRGHLQLDQKSHYFLRSQGEEKDLHLMLDS